MPMKLHISSEMPIDPLCSHFGKCGGCSYQHIPYDEQLLQKEHFVHTLFQRETSPILSCDPPWHYRNKMEFSFSQDRKGQKFLGLMRKRGRVENLSECFLTAPWFIEVLERVRLWWEESALAAYHPPSNEGSLRTLTIRHGVQTDEKMVVLTVSGNPDFSLDEAVIEDFMDAVGEVDSLILRTQIIAKKTPTRFEERLLAGKEVIHEIMHNPRGRPFTFRIRAASFFQPNTLQAEALYALALESAELSSDETVFDLYCGTGTLGIFASTQVAQVYGIELVPEAVLDAQENIKLNEIANMSVVAGDVGERLLSESPSTVIVDPPRAGLSAEALNYLADLSPKKILYISCNPVTQAQNCADLEGYQIERIQPVDQFPHTPHVENVVLLRKF